MQESSMLSNESLSLISKLAVETLRMLGRQEEIMVLLQKKFCEGNKSLPLFVVEMH